MVCPRLLAMAFFREISELRGAKPAFRLLSCWCVAKQVNVAGRFQSELNVERQTLATFILAAESRSISTHSGQSAHNSDVSPCPA
jgi:hypothetical protein